MCFSNWPEINKNINSSEEIFLFFTNYIVVKFIKYIVVKDSLQTH